MTRIAIMVYEATAWRSVLEQVGIGTFGLPIAGQEQVDRTPEHAHHGVPGAIGAGPHLDQLLGQAEPGAHMLRAEHAVVGQAQCLGQPGGGVFRGAVTGPSLLEQLEHPARGSRAIVRFGAEPDPQSQSQRVGRRQSGEGVPLPGSYSCCIGRAPPFVHPQAAHPEGCARHRLGVVVLFGLLESRFERLPRRGQVPLDMQRSLAFTEQVRQRRIAMPNARGGGRHTVRSPTRTRLIRAAVRLCGSIRRSWVGTPPHVGPNGPRQSRSRP
jgi:hypothetical protein